MKARGFWQLGEVSDDRLVAGLRELLTAEGRNEAHIVAHLAEVDARRLHLKRPSPSLFEYCQKELGLSDNQAYYRVAAARVARRFPVVFELLEQRRIHLTNVAPLTKHLTRDNHAELLAEAGRLSRRELLRYLARRYPQIEVANRLRKLPGRPLVPQAGTVSAGPTGSLEPRSDTHYRLQLNLPEAVKEKLELARDLMSHANPSGDLALVVERGLDLLIVQLQKKRFGQTSRPRKNAAPTGEVASNLVPAGPIDPLHERENIDRSMSTRSSEAEMNSAQPTRRNPPPENRGNRARKHIPHATRRKVLERDGFCCSYVSEDGVRCSARAFLQIDHRLAWARGGPNALKNLRLLCHAHNQLMAEQEFGETHQRRVIGERRVRRGT